MSESHLDETAKPNEIIIHRLIRASRERVWNAMTDPAQVVHWWGPNGFTTTIDVMDFKVGGIWKHTMVGPDGSRYPNKSVFKEIVKHERVVYSHGGGEEGGKGHSFTAYWIFSEQDSHTTQLTLRMVFPTSEDRDMVIKNYNAQKGGEETLARLDGFFNEAPLVFERTYDVPVERLWSALTDKEEMKQWYFDVPAFKPEVGCEFTFTAGKCEKQFRHVCTVTEAVENKKIAYTWRYDGYEGNSEVSFELFPQGSSTLLRLTHVGLHTFPEPKSDFGKENFVFGWTYFVYTALADYLK